MIDGAACTQLHDQVHMCALVDDLVEFHDIRVPQIRQGIYLSMHCHLCLLVLQVLFIVGLDGDGILRLLVRGTAHNCKGALAYLKANGELSQVKGLLVGMFPPSTVNMVAKVSELNHLYFLLHFLSFCAVLIPSVQHLP